jgi:hypothetical protein
VTAPETTAEQISRPDIPGQVVKYGNWRISYNPPPIPSRNCDWQFCHKDFDGAEDACDDRYGSAETLLGAMDEIDLRESEAFVCERCPAADPSWCMQALPCEHRDDQRLRQRLYDLAKDASHAR